MQLKTFITRPVLSSVISILIVVVGVIGLTSLPVEQYPDIAPPMVSVSTNYYGASAQTIQKAVIAPLEEAINGVEDMIYMNSVADNSGAAEIMVYFKQGTNADMAAVNVQNRIAKVQSQLPAEVKQLGVQTVKQQNSMLQIFAISSPDDTYDSKFLCNYLNINIKPKIMRIPGIGKFSMFGAEYAMRIWLKPDVMASYGLQPSDVLAALAEQNIEAATGSFGENSGEQMQYSMVYKGRLKSEEEFAQIIIRTREDGQVLRLSDVAKVELGTEHYIFESRVNGHPGALCVVYQTAGSNATQVNEQIAALLKESEATLPSGTKIDVLMNTNDFLYASMHEVVKTLLEAILLVFLIVLLFLHDFRSTLIPFVGIFVSLIGTFAFMMLAGFSLNLISLFALVLVIGTVVDDAIVVVEAVHEKLDSGYTSPLKASVDAMQEITMAVITSSLVFMAVFIPVSFMGGTSGVFFRQFGLTMAVAVGISAINALTLSPALCAILLKSNNHNVSQLSGFAKYKTKFSLAFNGAFERMAEKYQNGIRPFIKHGWISLLVVVASVLVMVWTMNTTPTGFVPQEDTCLLMCDVILPPSTSLSGTRAQMDKIQQDIQQIDDIASVGQINGYAFSAGNASNHGCFIARLKPWEQREFMSVKQVSASIAALNNKYQDATIVPFMMPMIPGYGASSDVSLNLQDKNGGEWSDFVKNAQEYLATLNQRSEVGMAYTSFNMDNPQWLVEVDVAKCHQHGLTIDQVLSTLATYYGGSYVNDLNLFGKIYKVMVQGLPETHQNERSLNTTFVRTASGDMTPLSTFVSLKKIYGAQTLNRFNLLNSITVNVAPAPGASSGDAIRAIGQVASEQLSQDYSYEFSGMAREESGGSSMALVFGISALIIYLILAALYESYLLPFSVLLVVPTGLMGAFLFTKIAGLENNIYLQTGVVMLIGLLSKTGILITEFAVQKRHQGMSIADAALAAAKARLRPILMTAGAMIFGLLPLLTSSGAGAMGNISLGVGTVFGMLIGSVALLFMVPALFVIFETLQEKIKPIQNSDEV